MATKFTPQSMAKMSALFETRTPEQMHEFEDTLFDEARAAGVLSEATGDGLTMKQWQIVRRPLETVRKAVLAAGMDL